MKDENQKQLAYELADELEDQKGLPFYITLIQKYPEFLLRQILSEVKAVPDEKIRKSRAALFNYLVQKHAKK